MNRDQKAVAIEQIAAHIDESDAIFAVDYRGISVAQIAELRSKLRDADATFKVVKNSLTERAADQVGAQALKDYLSGPTALTFVRGDVAVAAKAVADYARATQLLPFKGGLMGADQLDVEQIRSLSRLPARDVLYGQLVGIVASPVSGLVRTLNALIGGLAVALGQVNQKKEAGELPAGELPAGEVPASADSSAALAADESPAAGTATAESHTLAGEADAVGEAPAAEEPGAAEAEESGAAGAEEPAAEESGAAEAEDQTKDEAESNADEPLPEEVAKAQETAAAPPGDQADNQAEPEAQASANDDNQADVSAQTESDDAETNPTKED
jgi:large subunit ribosomal protein L10